MHPYPFMVIQSLAGDPTVGARATDPTLPAPRERRAWRLGWLRRGNRDATAAGRRPPAATGHAGEERRRGWAHSQG